MFPKIRENKGFIVDGAIAHFCLARQYLDNTSSSLNWTHRSPSLATSQSDMNPLNLGYYELN